MPHLTLEYTKGLIDFDQEEALLRLNRAIFETGHFDEIDIKSRTVALDHYAVGITADKRAFVHAKLSVMSNRSPEIKSTLSKILLQELRRIFPSSSDTHIQICAEIIDIDRGTYEKAVVQPASS
jgi:5-carboxymethyl-2-hydroxymuconate isomerase